MPWGISGQDLNPTRSWPSSQVPQGNEGGAGEAWHSGTRDFLLSLPNELGYSCHGDTAPGDHTMRWERWAEPEMLRVRERGQGWGFLVPQAVPSSPASPSPRAQPISPSPGTKRGFSSACSGGLSGQASGSGCSPCLPEGPALGGETTLQAMFFFAFSPLTEARQRPACCLPPRSALEKTLLCSSEILQLWRLMIPDRLRTVPLLAIRKAGKVLGY